MPHVIRKTSTNSWKHKLSTGRMCELRYSDEDNGFTLNIDKDDIVERIFQYEDLHVIKDIINEAINDSRK